MLRDSTAGGSAGRGGAIRPDLAYRADIDGLRAIAVLGVILFHSDLGLLGGGYVGVDVFFVISGYLITQRIVKGHEAGGFSYREFYLRRVRRLFPALVTTVAGTLAAGVALLGPAPLMDLARSAIGATLSFANVHFLLEAGYWESSVWSQPLLHTWSLSVEEQFYLVWPALIVALLSWFPRHALRVLVGSAVLSLAITALVTGRYPDAAFYLTPFRHYEFAIGAICVWLDRRAWPASGRWPLARAALFTLGLGAILASMTRFGEGGGFPGWLAAIPTLGTAAVILARAPAGLHHLLSNPVARYLGLISYSLYLVHWPVLVFLRPVGGTFDGRSFGLAVGLTLLLSVLQYHGVETPLRRPPRQRAGGLARALLAAGAAALAICAASMAVLAAGGLPSRFGGELEPYGALTQKRIQEGRFRLRDELCREGRDQLICGRVLPGAQNVLVVGDSHAPDGLNILSAALPEANLLLAAREGCPLLRDLTGIVHADRDCEAHNRRRFRAIDEVAGELDAIVLSQRMSRNRLDATLATVAWIAPRWPRLVVLGAGPQFRGGVRIHEMLPRHSTRAELNRAMAAQASTRHYEVDDLLAPAVEAAGGVYVRKRDFFCPGGRCWVIADDGTLLSWDSHHLTEEASRAFGEYLAARRPDLLGGDHGASADRDEDLGREAP